MSNFYVRGEDLAVGFTGPFADKSAAEEHKSFCESRGDQNVTVVTEEEMLLEDKDPFVLSPTEDRNFQF